MAMAVQAAGPVPVDQPQREQQRAPHQPGARHTIVGTTHPVKPAGRSIYAGTALNLLAQGTAVEMTNGPIYRSRRGPNQEEHKAQDKTGKHQYLWYPIKYHRAQADSDAVNAYVREDTLSGFAAKAKAEISGKLESSIDYPRKMEQAKPFLAPAGLLKVESVLSFGAAILKLGLAGAFTFFGHILGGVGQLMGAIGSTVVGVLKWMRANLMNHNARDSKQLISEYQTLYNVKNLGQNQDPAQMAQYHQYNTPDAAAGREQTEATLKTRDNKINKFRIAEALASIFGKFGSILSGAFYKLITIVPDLVKLVRGIAQLKGWITSKRILGVLITIESILGGLFSIFGVNTLAEQVGLNTDPVSPIAKAAAPGAKAIGTGTAAIKGTRGAATFDSAKGAALSKEQKQKLKKEMSEGKRLRKQVQAARNEQP